MEEVEGTREVEEVEGTAAETPTAEAPPAAPELKVVIHLKGTRAIIGIQGTDTDPVVETLAQATGSLEEALAYVPGVVERARERWATSPRNPKYEGPPPPPAPTPAPGQPARRAATPRVETPRMF
jgi:hypothetical protein